jgi:hypothetical protein
MSLRQQEAEARNGTVWQDELLLTTDILGMGPVGPLAPLGEPEYCVLLSTVRSLLHPRNTTPITHVPHAHTISSNKRSGGNFTKCGQISAAADV